MTTIITDNKWRDFHYRADVPSRVLADQFDWLSEENGFDGFIRYRRRWYHLSEFLASAAAPGFDGISADSYFSAVAIKVSRDGEQYRIATILS